MSLNTSQSTTVSQALESRITVRRFLDTPVPDEVLKRLLTKALRSPSGGNLQPWKLHVLRGSALRALVDDGLERSSKGQIEHPTYEAYPKNLWEPQRSWRYKLGEDMYALLNLSREDKAGRIQWLLENMKFFHAPVGIIITGHTRLGMPQHLDIGLFLQSLMLLAREEGLHTASQGFWRHWPDLLAQHLNISENEEVLVGLSLGYGDCHMAVNNLYSDRADLNELATFYGQDD